MYVFRHDRYELLAADASASVSGLWLQVHEVFPHGTGGLCNVINNEIIYACAATQYVAAYAGITLKTP